MLSIIILLFVFGYLCIIFEEKIRHDKTSIALLLGTLLWIVLAHYLPLDMLHKGLDYQLLEISEILFFLMGAMTIVELIDINQGFDIVLKYITIPSKRQVLLYLAVISFLFSAFLDNLTTAIVMTSMSRKIFENSEEKKLAAGMIIIASNAGGAWSPLGDITTTMLWIGNRVSALHIISQMLIPCTVSVLVSYLLLVRHFKGTLIPKTNPISQNRKWEKNLIFIIGMSLLVFVPILKLWTGLPPYISMIFCVGLFWLITELFHKSYNRKLKNEYSIYKALERLDLPSILFFFGILLCVGALKVAGVLDLLAIQIQNNISNTNIFTIIIGLFSSIFDNVPILAAVIGMYSTDTYPIDDTFWIFLAYSVGLGGSMLVIGSAAGVAVMNSEKIQFGWYLKKISFPALIGFIAGACTYLLFY